MKEATFANWFGARVPSKPDEVFTNLAVDAPTYLRVDDEIELSEADKARWLGNKSGALVGAALAEKTGWSVGQKIVLAGTYYPGDWELEVAGIYKSSQPSFDQAQLFLHWGYVNDALDPAQRDRIGWINASLSDPARSAQISTAIDQMFDAKDTPTLTMTEHGANVTVRGVQSDSLAFRPTASACRSAARPRARRSGSAYVRFASPSAPRNVNATDSGFDSAWCRRTSTSERCTIITKVRAR